MKATTLPIASAAQSQILALLSNITASGLATSVPAMVTQLKIPTTVYSASAVVAACEGFGLSLAGNGVLGPGIATPGPGTPGVTSLSSNVSTLANTYLGSWVTALQQADVARDAYNLRLINNERPGPPPPPPGNVTCNPFPVAGSALIAAGMGGRGLGATLVNPGNAAAIAGVLLLSPELITALGVSALIVGGACVFFGASVAVSYLFGLQPCH